MVSNSKNIAVNSKKCLDVKVNDKESCLQKEFDLCLACLDEDNRSNLNRAYQEHSQRGGFKRLFPVQTDFFDYKIQEMSPKNQMNVRWFKSKCEENKEWC